MLCVVQDQREPTVDVLVERAFATEMLRLREDRGMSQTRLAQALEERYGIKIDGSAITRIERRVHDKAGARALTLGEAVAIAGILGISIDGLTDSTRDLPKQLDETRRRLEQWRARRDSADAEYNALLREYEQLRVIAATFAPPRKDVASRRAELRKHRVYMLGRMNDLQAELAKLDSETDPDEYANVSERLEYAKKIIWRINRDPAMAEGPDGGRDVEAGSDNQETPTLPLSPKE